MEFVRTARPGKKLGRSKSKNSRVAHRSRCEHKARHPVHATLKLAEGLPGLRNKRALRVIQRAFYGGKARFGFRLNHDSVQGNHMHLIVEAQDRLAMTRGMKGLAVRLARGLNSLWQRTGKVFPDRYHEHVLTTPREVRNVLAYVLKNWNRHARAFTRRLDEFASGPWFDGWGEAYEVAGNALRDPPIVPAETWLSRVGWRRHGLVPVVAHD
jgi:REP element-mobilizing transposase RayT